MPATCLLNTEDRSILIFLYQMYEYISKFNNKRIILKKKKKIICKWINVYSIKIKTNYRICSYNKFMPFNKRFSLVE